MNIYLNFLKIKCTDNLRLDYRKIIIYTSQYLHRFQNKECYQYNPGPILICFISSLGINTGMYSHIYMIGKIVNIILQYVILFFASADTIQKDLLYVGKLNESSVILSCSLYVQRGTDLVIIPIKEVVKHLA